tara:strand:+ start:184 stop:462 length:279 start_codon:yes stop_codon:yes gene_type:complete
VLEVPKIIMEQTHLFQALLQLEVVEIKETEVLVVVHQDMLHLVQDLEILLQQLLLKVIMVVLVMFLKVEVVAVVELVLLVYQEHLVQQVVPV